MEKVSIVINSYRNNANHLIEAIKSYQMQRDVETELIVSTVAGDSAVVIAKEMDCKVVINKTPGIYSQLNAALKEVTGDWFAYASGNDIALPSKLIDEVISCKETGKLICYSSFYACDGLMTNPKHKKFHEYNYEAHLKGNFVNDCALMHKSILDKYCPFKEEYGNHAYWDFWLRVFEGEGDVFCYNPVPEWKYRINKNSQHVIRQHDEKKKEENRLSREKMLNEHIKNK